MTIGAKFWKTVKIVRAVKEDEYRDFELIREGQPKRHSSTIHISSDSESDTYTSLIRHSKHRASMVHTSGDLPPQQSTLQSLSDKVSEQTALLQKLSADLSSKPRNPVTPLKQVLSCIICKELAICSDKQPLVPKCCSAVVGCKECFEEWLRNSPSCPYCRVLMETTENYTAPLPELRPLISIMEELNSETTA